MVMRRIWSFWDELEAKVNVCHNVRLMHVSTSSHFFLSPGTDKCRLGLRMGNREVWADILEGFRACLCLWPTY